MHKDIEFVKKGYGLVAEKYRAQLDVDESNLIGIENKIVKYPIFRQWFQNPNNQGKILELGCASGYPVGEYILSHNRDYIGIDLSEKHISMAHEAFPSYKSHFLEAEMVEFCCSQTDNSYTGVISLFSIRHLPRIYHAELFMEIHRILKPKGVLFIDLPHCSDEGIYDWFGEQMFWSHFSPTWNRLTLTELGFTKLNEYQDPETLESPTNYYILCQK